MIRALALLKDAETLLQIRSFLKELKTSDSNIATLATSNPSSSFVQEVKRKRKSGKHSIQLVPTLDKEPIAQDSGYERTILSIGHHLAEMTESDQPIFRFWILLAYKVSITQFRSSNDWENVVCMLSNETRSDDRRTNLIIRFEATDVAIAKHMETGKPLNAWVAGTLINRHAAQTENSYRLYMLTELHNSGQFPSKYRLNFSLRSTALDTEETLMLRYDCQVQKGGASVIGRMYGSAWPDLTVSYTMLDEHIYTKYDTVLYGL